MARLLDALEQSPGATARAVLGAASVDSEAAARAVADLIGRGVLFDATAARST